MHIVDDEEAVLSHFDRGILRRSETHVVAVEIAARRIRGREGPELVIESRGRRRIRSAVLGHRLHGPVHRMSRYVLHGGAKLNSRGLTAYANGSRKLNASLRVRRPGEFHFAISAFRKFSKGEGPVIEKIGVAHPVLLVIISFGQEPEFVASVIEPLVVRRRKILA